MGSTIWRQAALALGACALCATASKASEAPPKIVNPAHYSSPSGKYVLVVDPDDKYGVGGASYRLSQNGHKVWSAHHPFTLLSVGVTDNGVVAGYGQPGKFIANDGSLETVIIDLSGKFRLDERTKQSSLEWLTLPYPLLACVNQNLDRVVIPQVVLKNGEKYESEEKWRQYRLSTGKPLPDFDPDPLYSQLPKEASLISAVAVSGTPLTLMRWTVGTDSLFTLLDPSYKIVWRQTLPEDYDHDHNDRESTRKFYTLYNAASIALSGNGSFTIRPFTQDISITYKVLQDKTGHWIVQETERVSNSLLSATMPRMWTVHLRSKGYFDLHVPGAPAKPASVQGKAPPEYALNSYNLGGSSLQSILLL